MVHSIKKSNDAGIVEIKVEKTLMNDNSKNVVISVNQNDFDDNYLGSQRIYLDEKEFFDLIGTMLFVQSQLKK